MGHVHLFQTNSQYHDMMICDILYIYLFIYIWGFLGDPQVTIGFNTKIACFG